MILMFVNKIKVLFRRTFKGKSAILKKMAAKADLEVIDIKLSQCNPTDISGLPTFNKETSKVTSTI